MLGELVFQRERLPQHGAVAPAIAAGYPPAFGDDQFLAHLICWGISGSDCRGIQRHAGGGARAGMSAPPAWLPIYY